MAAHYEFEDPTYGAAGSSRRQKKAAAESGGSGGPSVGDDCPLGIPDMEVFALFQKNRVRVLEWLKRGGREANEVFESVVHCITLSTEEARAETPCALRSCLCFARMRLLLFVPSRVCVRARGVVGC